MKSTGWCLLDARGEVVEKGKSPTTPAELTGLVQRLAKDEPLVAAQECGKLSHFVHDVVSPLEVKLLTFNPYHLRVIAASRKKTDKRDAYWLAKTVQSGMTPHPVFPPLLARVAATSEVDVTATSRPFWRPMRSVFGAAGLRPGGCFVLDIMNKERLARVFAPASFSEAPRGQLMFERRHVLDGWERIENTWYVLDSDRYEAFTFRHFLYSGSELRDLLQTAGFRSVSLYGSYAGAPFVGDARLHVVARA